MQTRVTSPSREPAPVAGARASVLIGSLALLLFQPMLGQARNEMAAARTVLRRIELVRIPGGTFRMGVLPSDSDAFQSLYPPRPAAVGSFLMSRGPITFAQYDAFARATDRQLPDDDCWGRGNRPVINVDWRDVEAFIAWLNLSGHRFRLPTEAEYEYAARAGTATRYWWGDTLDASKANTAIDERPDKWPHTSPVGAFPANPYGLVDIVGNIWEWTATCFDGESPRAHMNSASRTLSPGIGATDCFVRVIRGGGWESISRGVRTTTRGAAPQSARSDGLGFRIVEDLPGPHTRPGR